MGAPIKIAKTTIIAKNTCAKQRAAIALNQTMVNIVLHVHVNRRVVVTKKLVQFVAQGICVKQRDVSHKKQANIIVMSTSA